jgi:hypothetical protein
LRFFNDNEKYDEGTQHYNRFVLSYRTFGVFHKTKAFCRGVGNSKIKQAENLKGTFINKKFALQERQPNHFLSKLVSSLFSSFINFIQEVLSTL